MMSEPWSRLRVLGYEDARDVRAIPGPVGSNRIERLELVPGSERPSITVGTATDSVTLHLSEPDFDMLIQLIHRLAVTAEP